MSDTTTTEERSGRALTRQDLADQNFGALNPTRVDRVQIKDTVGGISFTSMLEVMEFSKMMAMSDKAVPPDFRANAGMCLAVTMQAIEWRMSPFQVANKAYVVNDRLAFESQLIHAIIEARAPLKERLNCEYVGEGLDKQIKVWGIFLDGTTREYVSPKIKDIKVKNSPLWAGDPEQQLFYFGSRAWSRRWCPDVILGVYSRQEIEDDPGIGREEPQLPGLHARLVSGNVSREEGHKDGQAAEQIKTINGAKKTEPEKIEPVTQDEIDAANKLADESEPQSSLEMLKLSAKTIVVLKTNAIEDLSGLLDLSDTQLLAFKGFTKAMLTHVKTALAKQNLALVSAQPVETTEPEPAKADEPPKNPAQWAAYCRAWLKTEPTFDAIRKRWNDERSFRNGCGVTSDYREPIQAEMVARCKELGEP